MSERSSRDQVQTPERLNFTLRALLEFQLAIRQLLTLCVMIGTLYLLEWGSPQLQFTLRARVALAISLSAGWTLMWCQTSGLYRALADLGWRPLRAQRVIWGLTGLMYSAQSLIMILISVSELHTLTLRIPHGALEAQATLCVTSGSQLSLGALGDWDQRARPTTLPTTPHTHLHPHDLKCVEQIWRLPTALARVQPKERARLLRHTPEITLPHEASSRIWMRPQRLIYEARAYINPMYTLAVWWTVRLTSVLIFGGWISFGYAPRVSFVVYTVFSFVLEALVSSL